MMNSVVVPDGFRLYTERGAKLLLPETNDAFLNPVQEFNRDLSVAVIRVWSEQINELKEKRWNEKRERQEEARLQKPMSKRLKVNTIENFVIDIKQAEDGKAVPNDFEVQESPSIVQTPREYLPQKIKILEPLSATGLRSIRYAQEIPLVQYVIANDLSPAAIEIMKRNVLFNDLGPQEPTSAAEPSDRGDVNVLTTPKSPKLSLGKVRVNEGDACTLMYSHRAEKQRVDVVDLDPYGTASPFIDGAVQCVSDGGLLCVTCTDMGVLGNTNYPEKCFANYGGVSIKSEYCHEAALRLVLHAISTSAARYGRFIQPLLSLSIDFYIRVFVEVTNAPIQVKKAFSKTSLFYVCSGCQSFHGQSFGKVVEKVNEPSGNMNLLYKTQSGPPTGPRCDQCGGTFHIGGPMWSGPLHNKDFTARLLGHIESAASNYGTSARMKGMVSLAHEELDTPFYFTPSRVASFFHASSPSLEVFASALLNAGYPVSRSHACPGSIKTTATREVVYDIFRSHVKLHPVKMENIKEGSPATILLAKNASFEANFRHHPSASALSSKIKLVRYQQNPTSHWGPASRPGGKKRKRGDDGANE